MNINGALTDGAIAGLDILRADVCGVDAGLTLEKIVSSHGGALNAVAVETSRGAEVALPAVPLVGVTGARGPAVVRSIQAPGDTSAPVRVVESQEIDAAARGVAALLTSSGRAPDAPWVLALLGTGTAFALVRGDRCSHLGGTPLGGGSFAGIARRIDPSLSYAEMIAAAARGDRRNVDMMISDAYAEGIGRVGPDLTAAHLSKDGGGSLDDVLAGLLNLHGENIAQIAASRAIISQARHVVLAGGFAHDNLALTQSIESMAKLFGVSVEVSPHPGFAGALGAALIATEAALKESVR